MQNAFFFASRASSARPNMPVSRFMKRNSHGNPKTVLKTLTDTVVCVKSGIFCYCHHITGKHLSVGKMHDFGGFAVFCDRYWSKHVGITFPEAKLTWESENHA